MKKIIAVLLLAIFVITSIPAYAAEDSRFEFDKSKSSILMCADTGDIIYENNAYEHLSPASVTKIMSILLVLEAINDGKISLDDDVSSSNNAVAMGGSQIWLEVGEKMTVDELLKAVIVASANDACAALAEYISGSLPSFIEEMNRKARDLGLENTNFENCTGLDDTATKHYSCAYDLAVIAREVLKYDIVYNYTTIWLDYLRNGKTELNNTNKLVNTYNGITGLKTGTTSKAGFCVCATAKRDDMNLIAVVLGADTSDERFNTATGLLDYGFANYELLVPDIDETQITDVKIVNGTEKSLKPSYDLFDKILIKKGSGDIKYTYSVEESINAPLKTNQKLGEIKLLSENNELKTIKLYAGKDVPKIKFSYIFREMLYNI
jgi:D-alanyl-D-alanine carboxypeptidase (penicillin-binding protein 5/6)